MTELKIVKNKSESKRTINISIHLQKKDFTDTQGWLKSQSGPFINGTARVLPMGVAIRVLFGGGAIHTILGARVIMTAVGS